MGSRVIRTTFETGLDTRSCYVTRRKGTAMEWEKYHWHLGGHSFGEKGPRPLFAEGRPHELGYLH